MLPLPNLDDKLFKQIFQESREKIHKLAPQWTDENYHDPGITFIDLLAWLTEMQQYYLNRITDKNELKFLKLLGEKLKEAGPARAEVTFSGARDVSVLPEGTKLAADDRIFEIDKSLILVPAEIEKIIVHDDADTYDYSSINRYSGVPYYAFGAEAHKGNRLFIGYDRPLPIDSEICVTVNLFEDYPIKMSGIPGPQEEITPSALVSWEYYGLKEKGTGGAAGWIPLQLTDDRTAHMTRSGYVSFRVPSPMQPVEVHPAVDKKRFWICCKVLREGYELPPKVDSILMNTVSAVQLDTLSRVQTFSGNGKPGQSFTAEHYLSYYGQNLVQVRDADGYWRYWEICPNLAAAPAGELCCSIKKEQTGKKTILFFGTEDHGCVPPAGEGNIRLISFTPGFAGSRFLGRSNGLPGQSFQLKGYQVSEQDFMLQVGRNLPGSGQCLWEDWERVDDFDLSGPADRHFIMNPRTGEIVFGDNEHGAVPEAGEGYNICIISCRAGGGTDGNVKDGEINAIVAAPDELAGIEVINRAPAYGGTEYETIDDAKRRLRTDLKKQYRAVTSRDFEEIALSTPGLRVARVKAIPLYSRGLKDYPEKKAPAQVTVVVVPYSECRKPVPGKGFLQTVKRHLDKYRLVTTEVHVIAPEYIKISVHAVVVTAPDIKLDPQKIVTALNVLLDPLDDRDPTRGWPFGRTVYKGDIYGVINRIEGVEYIKDLWINAEGAGISKELSGDIKIPPHGLVYSGDHMIEAINRKDL